MNWPEGWRSASYADELVPEQLRQTAKPGAMYKNPQTGSTLQKQTNGHWKKVGGESKMAGKPSQKGDTKPDVSKMKKLAEGNYGIVYEDPSTNHVVKTLKEGKEWGPHEIELGKRMGELGHSPKIHSSSPEHIEMDKVSGKPLWSGGFNRTPEEKERDVKMTPIQAAKSLKAIKDLHKMGFYHGDMHNEQFLTDGEGGSSSTLIDYGLSGKIEEDPRKAIIDFNKVGKLIDIDRSDFDDDPYVQLVRDSIKQFKAAKGTSKAAKEKQKQAGIDYFKKLSEMDS